MNKNVAVLPMAGLGSRFINAGFKKPKFLIEFEGKYLLEHSVNSLPTRYIDKYVFIVRQDHIEQYPIEKTIKEICDNTDFEIVVLKSPTQGQAETVLKAKKHFNNRETLLIFNIDTKYRSDTQSQYFDGQKSLQDGFMGSVIAQGNNWSFAKLDPNSSYVVRTAEKERISEYALTGLYCFSNSENFVDSAERAIAEKDTVKGEYYIAPLYNRLINSGQKFTLDLVDSFTPLGTPEELLAAKSHLGEAK